MCLASAEHPQEILHQLMEVFGLLRLLQETGKVCTLLWLQRFVAPSQQSANLSR